VFSFFLHAENSIERNRIGSKNFMYFICKNTKSILLQIFEIELKENKKST